METRIWLWDLSHRTPSKYVPQVNFLLCLPMIFVGSESGGGIGIAIAIGIGRAELDLIFILLICLSFLLSVCWFLFFSSPFRPSAHFCSSSLSFFFFFFFSAICFCYIHILGSRAGMNTVLPTHPWKWRSSVPYGTEKFLSGIATVLYNAQFNIISSSRFVPPSDRPL